MAKKYHFFVHENRYLMSLCPIKINGVFFSMIFVIIEDEFRNLNNIQVSPDFMQGFTQNKRLFQELKSILVSRLRPKQRNFSACSIQTGPLAVF